MVERTVSSGIDTERSDTTRTPEHNEKHLDTASVSWLSLGVHRYIRILVIGILLICIFKDEFYRVLRQWTNDASWSHGFLIPLFSLYFINQRKKEILSLQFVSDPLISFFKGAWPAKLLPGQARADYLGLVFLIFGLSFYFLNLISPSGYAYFRCLGILIVLGSIVLFLGGWRLVHSTWLPVCFLIFAIPLPQRFYVAVTMPMRRLAAAVAAVLLNFVNGIEARVSGVVIDIFYNGRHLEPPLNVAEACSGMRLLMAFLALGVAMAYLHYRPVWQRIVLLASTVPIAVFCNIVRVTVTGFIHVLLHPKYTQGIYHDSLGMAMLPLAFGMYGFLAWFMSNLFVEDAEVVSDVVERKR